MKINLPVSGQERLFDPAMTLVSKTDTKGIITFANRDFVEVSGFSEQELVGTNHNIIRHPDMPPAAFESMWKTLKRGFPWHGVVKNRCKNGDHYWVDAKIVPIKKSGTIIGYMSVRRCPSRADVANAEAIYARAAEAPETLAKSTAAGWKKHLSIRNGIPLWILFVTLLMVAGGILGITGLNLSNSALQSLHDEEMNPVQTIGRINFLMADNRAQMVLALHHNPLTHPDARHDHPLAAHLQTMDKNKGEIDRLWESYSKGIKNEAEKKLADRYWQARNRYVQEGLLQARRAFEAGDYPQAETVLLDHVTPLYDTANADVSVLLQHLSQRGHERFTAVAERNRTIAEIAVAGIALGTLALVFAGIFFFRATVMPLQKAVLALEDIAEGNLSGHVEEGGYGEPGRVMAAVTVMQMHLKVMMHEIRQSSDSIYRQCANLNRTMMNLAEHSDEQHDRIYRAIDAIGESCTGLRAMAANAEALMQGADDDGQPDVAGMAADEPQDNGLEPIPAELLAIFGDSPDLPAPDTEGRHTDTTGTEEPGLPPSAGGHPPRQIQALADAARLQTFAVDDVAAQLNQVASLIVQNREEVQGAWAASQQLEKTADELEKLVKYFE